MLSLQGDSVDSIRYILRLLVVIKPGLQKASNAGASPAPYTATVASLAASQFFTKCASAVAQPVLCENLSACDSKVGYSWLSSEAHQQAQMPVQLQHKMKLDKMKLTR